MPDVTVVIPAYNAERTIGETLASVLAQTFGDFEVIVVDDGSTDRTADLVRDAGDHRVRVLSVPNGGVARARNRGIEAAIGRYMAFLDADDVWKPEKLERQLETLSADPGVGMCFAAATRIDAKGEPIGRIAAHEYTDYCEALLLDSVVVSGSASSILLSTALAREIGGFDPSFSQTADWDFYLRLSRTTRFAAIRDELTLYRTHPGQMSSDISLLERDTFAVLDKFFADPRSQPYVPVRSRAYSNHWMICSGSYLHAGQLRASLRCLLRGVRADPRNVRRPLGLPWRWMSRLGKATVSPA